MLMGRAARFAGADVSPWPLRTGAHRLQSSLAAVAQRVFIRWLDGAPFVSL